MPLAQALGIAAEAFMNEAGLECGSCGVLLGAAGEEACTNRYMPPLGSCHYFDVAVVVSSWPAMCLRSFGYSTISIRRLDDRPSSESFEARG